MTEPHLDYALRYAGINWPVLPLHWIGPDGYCSCGNQKCKSPGKHPLVSRGIKDCSKDPATINGWFNRWPLANIGVVTGKESGILALDIDPRHAGNDSLDEIVHKYGRVPDDVMAITGSGGAHYLFKYPGQVGRSTTNLYPGIDTRGDGGYIVVAPSNHASGRTYFWDAEADPVEGAIPATAPAWLLEKLAEKNKPAAPVEKNSVNTVIPLGEVKNIRAALFYILADDRDQWRKIGMALHSTGAEDQAFGLWCEWSQQSDKFDLKDQRRVWSSFKLGGGVTLAAVFGIAKQAGWVQPEVRRDTQPSKKQPRPPNKPLISTNVCAEVIKRYVFLISHNRIYDTVTRNELTREAFDGAYAHLIQDIKPSVFLLKNSTTIKVDDLIYLPGETKNPVQRNGATLWNIWLDPKVLLPDVATREDIATWLEHLGYLYPNHEEQTHLINWMACTLQNPQEKINHALLVAGKSRVGKDMLLNPLRYGLGAANVCEPPAGELKESFTDYLHHSKLVIFQEIQTFEGLNLENKLKPMLASPPEMLRVRLFGRGFYETPNIVQAIFMSNYRDALHISEGDGRYFTVWTDAEPLSKEYYSHLWKWLEDGGNGLVVRWLLDRDISGFNPKQPAPLTAFKAEMIGSSKSPLKHQISDMIDAADYPFNVDCVRSIDVAKAMRDKFSSKSIGSVLGEIGCVQLMCRRASGTRGKVSLFAVRNQGEWKLRSPIKWLDEYDARRS